MERQVQKDPQARQGDKSGRYRYAAFISYSHAADGRMAPALRDGLHWFAKPLFALRALRVFRDETSLSANPALWPSIETALSESRFFILMASPQAAASPWVDKELAILLALEALPRQFPLPNRPYEPLAEVALARGLYRHRLQGVLSGHEDEVTSGVFSPDGSRIVTVSDDFTARLWDAQTGEELAVLHGHESAVVDTAFNPGGTLVATASWDHTVRIWEVPRSRQVLIDQARQGLHRSLTPDERRRYFLADD